MVHDVGASVTANESDAHPDVSADAPPGARADVRRDTQGKYDPTLTLSDPLDRSYEPAYEPVLSLSDPLDLSDPLGGAGERLGGIDLGPGIVQSDASGTGAHAAGGSSSSDAAAADLEPGWHVDFEGRSVLIMPKGAPKFSTVVVEYEEGARICRPDGEQGGSVSSAVG